MSGPRLVVYWNHDPASQPGWRPLPLYGVKLPGGAILGWFSEPHMALVILRAALVGEGA